MASRGLPCTQCQCTGCMLDEESGLCCCDHSVESHAVASRQAEFAFAPAACLNGASMFVPATPLLANMATQAAIGRTLCRSCGVRFVMHREELIQAPPPPPPPPSTAPITAEERSRANAARNEAAFRHRPTQPTQMGVAPNPLPQSLFNLPPPPPPPPGAFNPMHFAAINPASASSSKKKKTREGGGPNIKHGKPTKVFVIIHPVPTTPYKIPRFPDDHLEMPMITNLRFPDSQHDHADLRQLILRARGLGLAFTLEARNTPEALFAPDFDVQFKAHLSLTSQLSQYISPQVPAPTIGRRYDWKATEIRQRKRGMSMAMLHELPASDLARLTWGTFYKKLEKYPKVDIDSSGDSWTIYLLGVEHPLLYADHSCLPSRLWFGLFPTVLGAEIVPPETYCLQDVDEGQDVIVPIPSSTAPLTREVVKIPGFGDAPPLVMINPHSEHVRNQLAAALESSDIPPERPFGHQFRIESDCVESAVTALAAALRSRCFGESLPPEYEDESMDNPAPSTVVHNCNGLGFNSRTVSASIGKATGVGVMVTIWEAFLRQTVSDTRYWKPLAIESGLYTLISHEPSMVTEDDLEMFRFFGFVIYCAIIWQLPLLPISPAIVALVIGTPELCCSQQFLDRIFPRLAPRIKSWHDTIPADFTLHPDSPSTLIFLSELPVSLASFKALSPREKDRNFTIPMYLGAVFGIYGTRMSALRMGAVSIQYIYHKENPMRRALQSGFFELSGHSQCPDETSFTKVIAAPDLISMLYSGRTISGSGDVMPFISVDFAAWGDWSDEATEIRDSFKDRFMELFTNYLNGTGHPDGIKTSRNQFEERAEKQGSITNIGDRALRSVLFVRALTSSVYLPIKSQSNPHPFVIRFTPSIKGGDSATNFFHTCFSTWEVLVTPAVGKLWLSLQTEVSSSVAKKQFEEVLHEILLDDAFNDA